MTKRTVYERSGVNTSVADRLSAYAGKLSRKTKSPFVNVNANSNYFRAPVTYDFLLNKLPLGCSFFSNTDGIGTKVGLHSVAGMYDQAGFDACAMVFDDAARFGNLALTLTTNVGIYSAGDNAPGASEIEKMHYEATTMIYDGIAQAAIDHRVRIIGGETAVLGVYQGGEIPVEQGLRFNCEAFITGVSHPDKLITGESLRAGQLVIALKEDGFRSNGISAVRKAFAAQYEEWYSNPRARSNVALAAAPSKIYYSLISALNGWFSPDFTPEVKIHAVAHITGGGMEGKFFKDILEPRGLSCKLYDLFEPSEIMCKCKDWVGMPDEEAYTTWNGGQGMLVVVDNLSPVCRHVISRAKEFGIEAKLVGEIYKWQKPRLLINSKFPGKGKRELVFK